MCYNISFQILPGYLDGFWYWESNCETYSLEITIIYEDHPSLGSENQASTEGQLVCNANETNESVENSASL